MPAPKTPQPDHTTPARADPAIDFMKEQPTEGAFLAAMEATYDMTRILANHNLIRAGRHHNDTGTRIPRRPYSRPEH